MVLLLTSFPCQAQEDNDNLLSLDLSYSLTGLLNQGWGIGLNFEKKLVDFLSFTGVFGHMTFSTGIKNVYCTSVNISMFSNYYPLSSGLDKLYISAGGGCDFMNYFGKGELPDDEEDILIHITPLIGWKFNVKRYLIIDVSTGYKFIVNNTENYKEIKKYVNTGFQFRLGFKILFNKLQTMRAASNE